MTDANYFQTMRIPLKRGRLYTQQEASEMRHVVVVNEAFARENFPGQDPIGQRVTINMKMTRTSPVKSSASLAITSTRVWMPKSSRWLSGRTQSWSIHR